MKYFRLALLLVLASLGLLTVECSPGSRNAAEPTQDDGFRMMVRLWPAHHDIPELTDQLIASLKKYDFCDEVWLCYNEPMGHAAGWHAPHVKAAGEAARKFRDAGIIPSAQAVFLGHGDGVIVGSYNGPVKDSTIHWGTMVGPDGSVCVSVNCPRQPEYLAYMEKTAMAYAGASQPYSLYIDDDLRITQHPPATEGCFCDLCIGLFNEEYKHSFTRTSLVGALRSNKDGGICLHARTVEFIHPVKKEPISITCPLPSSWPSI